MDSWEAVIAVVFGSMTGSKQPPTLFEALPPLVTYPDAKSEEDRAKRNFREARICKRRRRDIPDLSNARSGVLLVRDDP